MKLLAVILLFLCGLAQKSDAGFVKFYCPSGEFVDQIKDNYATHSHFYRRNEHIRGYVVKNKYPPYTLSRQTFTGCDRYVECPAQSNYYKVTRVEGVPKGHGMPTLLHSVNGDSGFLNELTCVYSGVGLSVSFDINANEYQGCSFINNHINPTNSYLQCDLKSDAMDWE